MEKKDKKILYTGLDPSRFVYEGKLVHCPLIETVPCSAKKRDVAASLNQFNRFTHLVFTSKTTVSVLFDRCREKNISLEEMRMKKIISVGLATGNALAIRGFSPDYVATPERAEGVIEILEHLDLRSAHVFFPRSSLARPLLLRYLKRRKISHATCILYQTQFLPPRFLITPSAFDEIVFTSPSTVEAFCHFFRTVSFSCDSYCYWTDHRKENRFEKKRAGLW